MAKKSSEVRFCKISVNFVVFVLFEEKNVFLFLFRDFCKFLLFFLNFRNEFSKKVEKNKKMEIIKMAILNR